MKKIKVQISFILLIILMLINNKIGLLFNYFSALILHELAHLLVARRKGYKLKHLDVSIFGVAMKLSDCIEQEDDFAINIAGPMCNLCLCLLCLAMFWLFPKSFYVFNNFCLSNFALAIFNLLPIYPLDGGKIFASIFEMPSIV